MFTQTQEKSKTQKTLTILYEMKDWLRFAVLCAICNVIIIITIQGTSASVIDKIDISYYVIGGELENFMFLINLFFTSLTATLLIKIIKKVTSHLLIIVLFEILTMITYQAIHIYHPVEFGDNWSWSSFFYDIIYVVPQVTILSIAIYLSQMIIGRKLLPTMYKKT